MKILVYGAGVIGCYVAHLLCKAGNDVTLLARNEWKTTLEKDGLTIYHHLQRRKTTDHPHIADTLGKEKYDMVFAVMQDDQLRKIWKPLSESDTDTVICVGNNMVAEETENYLTSHSPNKKQVVFGFVVCGGERKKTYVVSEHFGKGTMDIGLLHGEASNELKEKMKKAFSGTGFKMNWNDNMDAFLKCHLCFILPLAYITYAAGGDFRNTNKADRKLIMNAAKEGYDLLIRLGIPIVPKNDDQFFRSGPMKAGMTLLLYLMSKTSLGDLVACAHIRHSVSEMIVMEEGFMKLRNQYPELEVPHWDEAKSLCPSWDCLIK